MTRITPHPRNPRHLRLDRPLPEFDEKFGLTLLRVAVRNFDAVFVLLEMLADSIGDEDRPVSSTGATDGNRHIGLPLLLVLGKEKVDEVIDVVEKLVRRLVRIHIFDHGRVHARVRLKFRYKVGIRQETDVENEVRVDRNTVFESEADQRYEKMLGLLFLEQTHGMLP